MRRIKLTIHQLLGACKCSPSYHIRVQLFKVPLPAFPFSLPLSQRFLPSLPCHFAWNPAKAMEERCKLLQLGLGCLNYHHVLPSFLDTKLSHQIQYPGWSEDFGYALETAVQCISLRTRSLITTPIWLLCTAANQGMSAVSTSAIAHDIRTTFLKTEVIRA